MSSLFCFGMGYVAKALASQLPNWQIKGTNTKTTSNNYVFNDTTELDSKALENVTHILISIPPTKDGDLVYLRLLNQLQDLKNLQWIGYLSSTSVYGDHLGDWVDETSATNPIDEQGKNRLLAETQWLSTNLPVNIFRLAGIYGPGRSVIDSILAGKATRINKAGHYFSRVHIDDIVEIIKKSTEAPSPRKIYNIADDYPCPAHEVVSFACVLMNKKIPLMIDYEKAEISPAMKRYYEANKRVSNQKVKKALDIKLLFPSYREGLKNLLEMDAA